ncbi:MAG: sulfopyruvate decarboxylase subunit alpha [Candidatus Hodarchaeota archaeon]
MSFEETFLTILHGAGVDVVLTNPCARIKEFLKLLEQQSDFDVIQLPREELGIGIAGGAFLAGKKPILLIQSTGLGNLLNSLASLTLTYQFPLLIFCSWRGVIDEPIEAQKRFGKALPGIFQALKVSIHLIEKQSDITIIEEVLKVSYAKRNVHIFLLSPRLWSKEFSVKGTVKKRIFPSSVEIKFNESLSTPHLTRYQAIQEIVKQISNDVALISNIGFPSKELFTIKDRPGNFYMTGSFGQVSAIGLGISRYTTRQVIVLDGDGSILMNPSILPMVVQYGANNLIIICLDNGTFGSTGDQPTMTWVGVNLELVAKSFGLTKTCTIYSVDEIKRVMRILDHYQFILIKIHPGNAKVGSIGITNQDIGLRFSNWLKTNIV